MITRGSSTDGRRSARPPDGVLLCMAVDDPRWAEQIPPVPDDFDVTVSLSPAAASDGHADALESLGYRPVGTDRRAAPVAAGIAGASVQFLVSAALVEARPTWYRALAERSERAFHLAHGPAAAVLAPLLDVHRESARGTRS